MLPMLPLKIARRLLLAAILLPPFAEQVQAAEPTELGAVRQEIATLGAQLQQQRAAHSRIERERRAQESELARLRREIDTAARAIETNTAQRNHLNDRRARLAAVRTQQEAAIRADLLAMHRASHAEPLQILLSQQDPAHLTRMRLYHRYLLTARQDRLASVAATAAELERTHQASDAKNAELAARRTRQITRQTDLETSLARSNALLEQTAARILSIEQQLAEREQKARRLAQMRPPAERNRRTATSGGPRTFAALKGRHPWPVAAPIKHRYGSQRIGRLPWQGVILQATAGTEVRSIYPGQVLFADYLRGQGLLVILDHGDGYKTAYGHNQSLFVQPGEQVAAGTVLALVGRGDGGDEAGLYFEIRHQGQPLDPAEWCVRRAMDTAPPVLD